MTSRRSMLGSTASLFVIANVHAESTSRRSIPNQNPTSGPRLEFVFEELVTLESTLDIGTTPYGIRRRVPISGGTFEGPRIRGKVLPGGADWQLRRPDGFTVIEADYMLQVDDGTLIHIYNKGLSHSAEPNAATRYIRTVPIFEAPSGPHEWLNQAIFVGTLAAVNGMSIPAVRIRIFKLT